MTASVESTPPSTDTGATAHSDESGSHGIHVFAAPSDAPRCAMEHRPDLGRLHRAC